MILYVVKDLEYDHENFKKGEVIDVSPKRAVELQENNKGCFNTKPYSSKKSNPVEKESSNVPVLLHD